MLEKMKEMLAEQLNCEASIITPETSFKDDLGADSLDLFELVMALEDEYNVEIPAEELTDLNKQELRDPLGQWCLRGFFCVQGRRGDSVGKPMDILKDLGI